MTYSFIRYALALPLTGALLCANAQIAPATPPKVNDANSATTCIAREMKAERLFGLWVAKFTNPPKGLPEHATMLLERHAEFSDSLAGYVSRDLGAAEGTPAIAGHAPKAKLAGDLDEGVLILDESSDNIAITGTWNAEMVPGSCGKAFQGVWKDTSKSAPANASDIPFVLTKLP